MCGVIGYFSEAPIPQDWDVMAALLKGSSIRGLHAFGVVDIGFTLQERALHLGDVLARAGTLFEELLPVSVIAHTRYSTSGDWRIVENNQPLVVGDGALVFNGVIDMRTKAEMEAAWGFAMQTSNDGELFLRCLESGQTAEEFLHNYPCSFAGCYFVNGDAFCIRNDTRPLWYSIADGATYITSTRDIAASCGLHPTELPAYKEFRLAELSRLLPVAAKSQQAGRLYSVPPSYADSRRYRPRVACDAVSGE